MTTDMKTHPKIGLERYIENRSNADRKLELLIARAKDNTTKRTTVSVDDLMFIAEYLQYSKNLALEAFEELIINDQE